jgi:hypothetical protein
MDQPSLPAVKAFVLQFSHDTDAKGGMFAGRVEHLQSGRRARFASAQELVAVLTRLLSETHEPTETE